MVRVLVPTLIFFLTAVGLSAQSETDRLSELQTAGYYELVDRARELGLPLTGGVTELRQRIAKAWNLVLPPAEALAGRTLTIDSAQEAGLVDVDAPGDGKLLRLSGGLHVTLVDNEKKVTHLIEAGELWYDQANEEMTARGGVVYTMIRESSKEVFRGESLTFRLNDSQGIFYGGASDRSRTVESQSLMFRYQGEAIRRSADDLVVLDTGTITSSLGAEPYYRIQAKKIWVLAPGEWGLQDAVLYLGRIPVLYFPFFFQPGDDFFFNPVLSFPEAGDRRGTSLQTTTYFLGKKKKDASPLSFLQMADSETEDGKIVKGLFLVKGKAPKTEIPVAWTLRLLADFYSNLGFLTAVDASLPGWAGMKKLTAFAGVGVTRTVDPAGVPYRVSPFQAALDPWEQSDWNGSWLGSWRLPFRWGGAFSVDSGWGGLSLEYYSDPLLASDLIDSRSENFSIFSLLGMGPAKKTAVSAAKSSLLWSGSLNLEPVSLTSSLLFDSKAIPTITRAGDPENSFYLPSQLTFPQATLTLGGTLWPPSSQRKSDTVKTESGLLPPDVVPPPNEPDLPAAESNPPESALLAPSRLDAQPSAAADPQWTTGASWSLKPTLRADSRFNTASVKNPGDSPWNVLTSRWSGDYDGRLAWNTGWSDGTWAANQTFSLHQQTQDTWFLSPDVTANDAKTYDAQDKTATSGFFSQALSSSWKPWSGKGAWRETAVQYSLGTKLWEQRGDAVNYYDGSKDTVTTHQASADAVWYVWEGFPTVKAQAGWQSTLPPLEPLRTWSGALDLSVPTAKVSTKTSARQTAATFVWDALDSNADWSPLTNVSLKESFQYDLQNARPSTSTSLLSAWGLSAQYRHQRTTPYRYDTVTKKWIVAGAQDFLPQELRFGYNLDLPSLQWWSYRNTLSSKLNFSWPIDLQQYSKMPLTLSYTLNYKLYRFLDLTVTEGIVNQTAYRYFPALTETFGQGVVRPVNPLADLWDAVSVWDRTALLRTGFKMTTLTVGLVHYLDDWIVKLDYSGSPQLKTENSKQRFEWAGTLTLLVQWYPVPELKTKMEWDRDGTLSILKNSP